MSTALTNAPAGSSRDASDEDASAKAPIHQPVLYPQTDLFHSRARQADLALCKRIADATLDPKFSRKTFEAFAELLGEARGRLMLRVRENGRG